MNNLLQSVLRRTISNRIARGALLVSVLRASGAGLVLVFQILVARQLGPAGAGLFFLAFTIATIAAVVGRFGLDNALLRVVSARAGKQQWYSVHRYYRAGLFIAVVSSSIVAGALFGSALPISRLFGNPALSLPLQTVALAIVPWSLLFVHSELLKALDRQVGAAAIQAFTWPAIAALCIPIFSHHSVVVALGILDVTIGIAALMSIAAWNRFVPHGARFRRGAWMAVPPGLLGLCMPLLGFAVISTFLAWTDVLFVGYFIDSTATGLYTAAARTASATSLFLGAMNSIAAPRFAQLFDRRDLSGLQALIYHATEITAFMTLPLLIIFLVAPHQVLALFGSGFTRAAPVLVILALGQLVNVCAGPVGYLLMMTGNQLVLQHAAIVAAVLNVTLNLVLIPIYGVKGAAIATSVSMAFLNITGAVLVRRRVGVWSFLGARLLNGTVHSVEFS